MYWLHRAGRWTAHLGSHVPWSLSWSKAIGSSATPTASVKAEPVSDVDVGGKGATSLHQDSKLATDKQLRQSWKMVEIHKPVLIKADSESPKLLHPSRIPQTCSEAVSSLGLSFIPFHNVYSSRRAFGLGSIRRPAYTTRSWRDHHPRAYRH